MDVSSWFELSFLVGSILYLVFDFTVLLLIFQIATRPSNEKENMVYMLLIQILIFVGGIQLLLIFYYS